MISADLKFTINLNKVLHSSVVLPPLELKTLIVCVKLERRVCSPIVDCRLHRKHIFGLVFQTQSSFIHVVSVLWRCLHVVELSDYGSCPAARVVSNSGPLVELSWPWFFERWITPSTG